MRAARTPSGKQVVIGPAPPSWCRPPSPRARAPRASCWRRQRGEYFVVRTDRVTPARIPALSEVEAKVIEAWQAEERRKLADAKVKAALEKANAGGDLARHRQGARPGAADRQGGHALRGRSPATTSPSRWCSSCSSWQPGKAAVGAQRRRQRDRPAQGDPAGRPRQGQGRARALRQAARRHGRPTT